MIKKSIHRKALSRHVEMLCMNECSHSEEYYRYRAMWRAVILQAFIDITNNYTRTEDKIAKYNAKSWLLKMSNDFIDVCVLADYDPYFVMQKAKEVIDNKAKYNSKFIRKLKRELDNEESEKIC